MNKKLIALGAAGAGVALLAAGELVHIYYDLMGRENKRFRSVLALFEGGAPPESEDRVGRYIKEQLEWINSQESEKLFITSDRGERLAGWLTRPQQPSRVFVLGIHGHNTDHNGDPAKFLRYYVEGRGYNFLAMDHIACGESEGKFCGFGYYESQDCLKWIDYLIKRFGGNIKIIIHGVSMGASTVCQMVSRVPPQVRLAVADCPFYGAIDEFADAAKGTGVRLPQFVISAFNGINRALAGFDLRQTDVRSSVAKSRVPILFIHGKDDTLIPISACTQLYEICTAPKDMLVVDGANHAESVVVDRQAYYSRLDDFIDKYL